MQENKRFAARCNIFILLMSYFLIECVSKRIAIGWRPNWPCGFALSTRHSHENEYRI